MTDQPTETPEPAQDTPSDSDNLGDAGKRAIEAERTARKAAEQQAKAFQEQLAALTDRAAVLEAANNDLTTTVTDRDKTILRQKVGLAKGLTADILDRLRGDDEESLLADAENLRALFQSTSSASTGNTPRPDPSQGARNPATPDPAAAFAATLQQALHR